MTQAIVGYLDLGGGAPDEALVHRMLDAITPEGLPSARAVKVRGAVGLGALSLRSHASLMPDQPSIIDAAGVLIAADARLYCGAGASMDTVLLEAISRRHSRILDELHGDFALACWRESDGTLTLLRDHFGVRPLYHTVLEGRYAAFATHPSGLLRTGLASRDLDPACIAQTAVSKRHRPPATRFRDVRALRPAHRLTVSRNGRIQDQRIWRMPLGRLLPLTEDRTAVAAEVRRLLEQAVHRRLAPEGPAFGHLSGGLDSTPIAVIAARAAADRGEDFHAFSIVEPEGVIQGDPGDERRFAAETVAMQPNMVPHWISPEAALATAESIDPDTGQINDPHSTDDQMGRAAAQYGIRIMLTGWAGDEVVTMRTKSWSTAEMFWSGRFRSALRCLEAHHRQSGISKARLFYTSVLRRALGTWFKRRLETDAWRDRPEVAFLKPAHRAALRTRLHWDRHHYDGRRARRAALEHSWIASTLENYALSGFRYGFSYAAPMVDLDLLRFANTLPQTWLWDGEKTRVLYRQAIVGLAPDSVQSLEAKLTPTPLVILRQAETRDALLARLDDLSTNELVTRFIDIPAVRDYVAALPSLDEAREAVLQYSISEDLDLIARTDHLNPILTAEFLARAGEEAA